jgi:hypothetical protein
MSHLLCAVEQPAGAEINIIVNNESHFKVLLLIWTDDLDRITGEDSLLP